MNTPVASLVEHEEVVETLDLVDLGDVSEETKGSPFGIKGDSGHGLRF